MKQVRSNRPLAEPLTPRSICIAKGNRVAKSTAHTYYRTPPNALAFPSAKSIDGTSHLVFVAAISCAYLWSDGYNCV